MARVGGRRDRSAPRPTATPSRNVVSGAASRSTPWAASRATSSRIRIVVVVDLEIEIEFGRSARFSQSLTFMVSGWRYGTGHAQPPGAAGQCRRCVNAGATRWPSRSRLEIRLDGEPWVVTMRTPGHDIDLVHGLLHAEGIIAGRGDVVLARYCAGTGPDGLNTYNVIDVSLAADAVRPAEASHRHVTTTSACGMCGAVRIEEITRASRYRLDPDLRWPAEVDLVRARPAAGRAEGVRADRRPARCRAAGSRRHADRCAARTSAGTTRSTR